MSSQKKTPQLPAARRRALARRFLHSAPRKKAYTIDSPVRDAVNKASTALFTAAYKYAAKPVIFAMKPDDAHADTIAFAHAAGQIAPLMGLLRTMIDYTDPILETHVMGLDFDNPFGLSAGLDKNGEIASTLDAAGFGFETMGSTTAKPCAGNPHPWFHRLPRYGSLLIHAGLNNIGSEKVIRNAEKAYTSTKSMKISVSIARTNEKNCGDDEEGIADYVTSMRRAAGRTHMIEVNISCPNTYVGERFVEPEPLDALLTELDKVSRTQPVLIKMPQDKDWPHFRDLLDVICEHDVQGVTIANLRKDRSGLSVPVDWRGNLSGLPAGPASNVLLENAYRGYGDRLALAGVGGVFTPEQAYWKIRHGASLVMFVSSLMFRGPQEITILKRGLARLLRKDGFSSVSQAVGIDVD
jgi:dihydroorotate dehydrogenase